MRKLVATLGALAFAVALLPASAAAADTFTGTCLLQGRADFGSDVGLVPAANTYSFDAAPADSRCDGSLNGGSVILQQRVRAQVSGPGLLSCGASASTAPGIGSITFTKNNADPADDVVIDSSMQFLGTVSEIHFLVEGAAGGEMPGHATFGAANFDPTVPTQCIDGVLGGLNFDAVLAGTMSG